MTNILFVAAGRRRGEGAQEVQEKGEPAAFLSGQEIAFLLVNLYKFVMPPTVSVHLTSISKIKESFVIKSSDAV